jgi:hypothetical protein
MKMYQSRWTGRLCTAVAALTFLITAVAARAADSRQLWSSREQFVALAPQEKPANGPAQPNDHPVELALDRLTAILESIDIRATAGGKPEALFTKAAIEVIAPELLNGLKLASPKEDVTFAVIGLHSALYGLAKSPRVTTGRVFYKDGRLNIILGLVQQEVRDRDDRRLFPFTPGSRNSVSEGDWSLPQQQVLQGFTQLRKDWLTFSGEWRAAVVQAPVAEQRPAAQITPPAPVKQVVDTRSPAERLVTLKELKDKGLINDEEYRTKRLEILNGL